MWLAVMGRPAPSGPLADLTLQKGRWATRPGEIDIDPHLIPFPAAIGSTVTMASAPGPPKLTVVGYASSIGPDEAAWVAPGQIAALRPAGAPAQQQMLYTFTSAGTAGLTDGRAIHITVGGKTATAIITGTVYNPGVVGALLTSWQTLDGAAGLAINQYIVALKPGVKPPAYAAALGKTLGHCCTVTSVTPGQSGSVGL